MICKAAQVRTGEDRRGSKGIKGDVYGSLGVKGGCQGVLGGQEGLLVNFTGRFDGSSDDL